MIVGLVALIAVLWTVVESLPALMTARYSLYEIVWLRYASHLLAMVVLLGPRRTFSALHTKRLPLQIGRGLLMLIMPISFIIGIERMAIHDVLAIFWLCPLWILGWAALVGRETVSWPMWALGVAAVIAGQLILRPDRDAFHSAAVFAVLLHATNFGRQVYVIGNNDFAARFSGVPVERVKFILFLLTGLMSGIAAVCLTSRLGSTRPSIAQGWELEVVTMVVLGGVSILGGAGTIAGVVIAAFVMGLVTFGLGLLNVPGIVMSIFVGLLLIITIALPILARRIKQASKS